MYKCPNCGGEIEFVPSSGKIRCEYCNSVFSPDDDLEKDRKNAEEHEDPGTAEAFGSTDGKIYTCSQCGASLYTTEETGVTFCSFCGSQAFIESRVKGDDQIMPELIVPFRISREQCEIIYKQKIKGAWFLPRAMKADNTIDKFRGIYMPCWVYTGEGTADGNYTTVKRTNKGSYDLEETFEVTVNARGEYEGFVEDSSSSFPDTIMREIKPFSMKEAVEFNDKYLAGFYADIGNVPSETYNRDVYESMDISLKQGLATNREIRGAGVTPNDINNGTEINAQITNVRKGFIPVWFLSNKNETTGRMSYAVINGLTGKIHTDLPVDMKKYLLVALAIAIPAFLFLQLFTMKPGFLLVSTMLLLGVTMFFSTKMLGEAYIQEHFLDDMGLLFLRDKAIAPARQGHIINNKPPKLKTRNKISRILFGLLCFIVIPFLGAIISVQFDVNLILWGFGGGIILYIIVTCGFKASNEVSEDLAKYEVKKKKLKLPFHMVLRAIAMPLIGIIAGIAVMVVNPAHDIYYYLAAVLCCVLLILTVLDFTRSTNRLALRKPAQLGKRGGDEDE